jgi:hypothetical protein
MKAVGGCEPMERHTIFRSASLTKPIAAPATAILVAAAIIGQSSRDPRLVHCHQTRRGASRTLRLERLISRAAKISTPLA